MTNKVLGAMLAVGLAACGSGASSWSAPPVLTEHDFAADPTLQLVPGQVGLMFMEAMGDVAAARSKAVTLPSMPDTDRRGIDVTPLRLAERTVFPLHMDETDEKGTIAWVQVRKRRSPSGELGELLGRLTPSNRDVKLTLEPGDYEILVSSGSRIAEEPDGPPATFLYWPAPVTAARSPTVNARVNAVEGAVGMLISATSCPGCNLAGANLIGANLNGVVLRGANLTGADLTGATLIGTDLGGATWTDGVKICAQGSIGACHSSAGAGQPGT